MSRHRLGLPRLVVAMIMLILVVAAPGASVARDADRDEAPKPPPARFAIARIYWEYNASANDLGVHVSLDAEDWRALKIVHPRGGTLFEVTTRGAYRQFGLTEMFFEGAEPSLDDVPLEELLAKFPVGQYGFFGTTVDGGRLESRPTLSHAIPAGPVVSAAFKGQALEISWQAVTSPPEGFPAEPITIAGYQVIVGSFQVTLPATSRTVTVPAEYVASLPAGPVPFEVLAIEASGNQTLTEGSFTKP